MKAKMAGKLMNLLKAGMGRAPDQAIRMREILQGDLDLTQHSVY